jgi:hypothetical protein
MGVYIQVFMQAFGVFKQGQCTMYDVRMEYMGAHAAVQVLQVRVPTSDDSAKPRLFMHVLAACLVYNHNMHGCTTGVVACNCTLLFHSQKGGIIGCASTTSVLLCTTFWWYRAERQKKGKSPNDGRTQNRSKGTIAPSRTCFPAPNTVYLVQLHALTVGTVFFWLTRMLE